MAVSTDMPMGPAWLMFFQNYRPGNPEPEITDRDRILKDDNELLEIITMLCQCDVIS